QEDQDGRCRSGIQLGPFRREGKGTDSPGQSSRSVRLLDVGEPEVSPARLRSQQRFALLSGAIRGGGAKSEYLLHRRYTQPAIDSGSRVYDEFGGWVKEKVLSSWHRLRLSTD